MGRVRDVLPTAAIIASNVLLWARPLGRKAFMLLGTLAAVLVALACTRVPFDAHRWLGTRAGECSGPAEVIVVLGGSGMPSGPELVRLHRAAEAAAQWPSARVLVIHPGPPSTLGAMLAELELRGVAKDRLQQVNEGNNTREQALILHARLDHRSPIAVITSPENTFRTVLAFRKAGLPNTWGAPAWDHAMLHNFDYGHEAVGGKGWIPDISGSPGLRYTFWNYLKLEVVCLREYAAIAYYWLNGWV
ncbi:MAG: YdcF family protein [Flavobacteriales bacterium]|nr:YdcF family protein [Flavobacteriales bacterium]